MKRLITITSLSFLFILSAFAAKKLVFHKIDTSICNQCGECIAGCPVQAIKAVKKDGKLYHEIDPKLCTQCGLCIESCEFEAIKIIEIEKEIKQEKKEIKEKVKK